LINSLPACTELRSNICWAGSVMTFFANFSALSNRTLK
jgi:hypothetical protein